MHLKLRRQWLMFVFAAVVGQLCTANGQAQPRTPDGHSDLQGIWTNSTMTLLERPIGLGKSTTLTDGRLPPFTPQAWRRLADANDYAKKHPADRAQDRSLAERCLLWAVEPPMLPAPYNSTYQIVQTSTYVMILIEMMHDVRIIPLDGRPHLAPSVRQWMGDSRTGLRIRMS